MDRWDATRTSGTNCNPKHRIQTLTHNEDWIKMIQESDRHCTNYKNIDYGVQDPKYKSFYICPCVYITTNDCDCCS